jgi:hypothetical protein
VRAIIAGTKTVTRRPVKEQRLISDVCGGGVEPTVWWPRRDGELLPCPYGAVGDHLWVRETHAQFAVGDRGGSAAQCVAYRASCDEEGGFDYVNNGSEVMRLRVTKWTPGIHMPRWAARLVLEVTDVRVERLRQITRAEVAAEGLGGMATVDDFRAGWDQLYRAKPELRWAASPWVWRVEFMVVEGRR